MKPSSTSAGKRTTVAVSPEFAAKLAELAKGHRLSVADYCDKHMLAGLTKTWRAMLTNKLKATEAAKGGE